MKRKTIAIVLAALLTIGLVGVAIAEVIGESNVSNLQMRTSTGDALDGRDQLMITVSNKEALELNALTFHMDFDTSKLEVTDIAFTVNGTAVATSTDLTPVDGKVEGGGYSEMSDANADGRIGFYYMDVTEEGDAFKAEAGGVQAVITFSVKTELAPNSTSDINLYEDSASNNVWFNLRDDEHKADTAAVTFTGKDKPAYMLGDVNGDEAIDAGDITVITDIILGRITPTNNQRLAGNVNGDEAIDAGDITAVTDHILGRRILGDN